MSKPTILVYAGPNGSGKTTVSKKMDKIGVYVNADDIKLIEKLTDMDAAVQAENIRRSLLESNQSFTFETVLSTDRNLLLLEEAKKVGYEIQCIYVITVTPDINAARVKARVAAGGHDVPIDKIYTRYERAKTLIPRLTKVCDKLLIYDNSVMPELIYEQMYDSYKIHSTRLWSDASISQLVNG